MHITHGSICMTLSLIELNASVSLNSTININYNMHACRFETINQLRQTETKSLRNSQSQKLDGVDVDDRAAIKCNAPRFFIRIQASLFTRIAHLILKLTLRDRSNFIGLVRPPHDNEKKVQFLVCV